ncbi:uncharacterized protein EV422DRAFT_84830 [Fimicolochytrium jonesii]|uniref:uncharacterized protein n=1 Tax=Fimicolochytrium jonesii TaxID=1396493 RepID=UPI0022FE410A|nr:uncharacterized protein EV422DRAFT_84830 [Fimicolochytrium jonesii]KAI8820250.1 hypothetical protein EV422DRAFT_84830 [Fimicolochytrium jonesii]
MGVVSKYEKLARERFEAIPADKKRKFDELAADNPEAKAFFDLFATVSKTVQPSSVTRKDLITVFGKEYDPFMILEASGSGFTTESFTMPADLPPVEVSQSFETQWADLEKYFDMRSEPLTRTYIDCISLEVMRHTAPEPTMQQLRLYGEISASYTSPETGLTLSGAGDYFLGYGERSGESLENLSLVGEAKTRGTKIGDTIILQTLSYMLMVHVARKRTKKAHPRVYGFATNGYEWVFLVIEDNGKLGRSRQYDIRWNKVEIWKRLKFVFEAARDSSPTTTPAVSREATESELVEAEGKEESAPYTFRLITQHPPMRSDEEDPE